MADSYVCSKAKIKCSCGDKISTLTVFPDRTIWLTGEPQANISDHVSMRNIAPFGKCHTTAYPPTGSATAAAHGKLTPMPCVPNTPFPWMGGKDDVILKGYPALLKSSTCKCVWGGTISITFDGQNAQSINLLEGDKRLITPIKQIPFYRELKIAYTPSFTYDNEVEISKREKAKTLFFQEISSLFNSCQNISNWLFSTVNNHASIKSSKYDDRISQSINEGGSNSNQITLYGYVSNADYQIAETDYSEEFIREAGDLFLLAFDGIPLIKNTKAGVTILIDAFVAALQITLSVGVDNSLRRYLQFEIESWIGGNYTDLVNFSCSKAHTTTSKKYTKAFGNLVKRYGKRLRVLQIKPFYNTCVDQPVYDWLDCGAYVNLDLKLDKILEITIGSENIQNVTDVWENGFIKISSTINLPTIDCTFGWDSNRVEEPNCGFFLETEVKRLPNAYDLPVGMASFKNKKDDSNEIFVNKSIYNPDKFDTSIVGKIGNKWTYTWQIENLLEERRIPK